MRKINRRNCLHFIIGLFFDYFCCLEWCFYRCLRRHPNRIGVLHCRMVRLELLLLYDKGFLFSLGYYGTANLLNLGSAWIHFWTVGYEWLIGNIICLLYDQVNILNILRCWFFAIFIYIDFHFCCLMLYSTITDSQCWHNGLRFFIFIPLCLLNEACCAQLILIFTLLLYAHLFLLIQIERSLLNTVSVVG